MLVHRDVARYFVPAVQAEKGLRRRYTAFVAAFEMHVTGPTIPVYLSSITRYGETPDRTNRADQDFCSVYFL